MKISSESWANIFFFHTVTFYMPEASGQALMSIPAVYICTSPAQQCQLHVDLQHTIPVPHHNIVQFTCNTTNSEPVLCRAAKTMHTLHNINVIFMQNDQLALAINDISQIYP